MAEGGRERMDGYFFVAPCHKIFSTKKLCQNTLTIVVILSRKGWEDTSPSPLLMRIKVI
jgi:hypothetical protein